MVRVACLSGAGESISLVANAGKFGLRSEMGGGELFSLFFVRRIRQ
jgi:hypothetical protein